MKCAIHTAYHHSCYLFLIKAQIVEVMVKVLTGLSGVTGISGGTPMC